MKRNARNSKAIRTGTAVVTGVTLAALLFGSSNVASWTDAVEIGGGTTLTRFQRFLVKRITDLWYRFTSVAGFFLPAIVYAMAVMSFSHDFSFINEMLHASLTKTTMVWYNE